MKKIYAVLSLLVFSGCAVAAKDADLQGFSSGHTGCPPEKNIVSEWKGGMGFSTWKAVCNGKAYRCTASVGGSSCKAK